MLDCSGYRAIAFKSGGKVYLRSRNDKDFNQRYSAIVMRYRTTAPGTRRKVMGMYWGMARPWLPTRGKATFERELRNSGPHYDNGGRFRSKPVLHVPGRVLSLLE
jgi:hypothetical protein